MAKRKRDREKDGEPPAAAGRPPAAPGSGKTKKAKPSWRAGLDFMTMLAGAVIIALLIKGYLFDIYLIPSGSMETALHGRPDGGDRILCSKLSYHFRDLQRWEVAVFKFPYESARAVSTVDPGILEQYNGQNFVKRVVGLPNETLAIARGDIWTRSGSAVGYQRQIKPDSVQRGMWLNVYEENFADLRRPELEKFWKVLGDARLEKGGPLVLSPGTEGVRLDYRPMIPDGPARENMIELAGIPDRYTVRQPVQFKCRNTLADGSVCGHLYVKTIQTQNMQARCPSCGSLQDETAAVFYHRRSGLPVVGRHAVDPDYAPQGEKVPPRVSDYHLVPDLRVVADVALADAASRFSIALREDRRFVQAVIAGDGRIEVLINGQASGPRERALAEIRPGRSHRVEFYIVEGTARLFVDAVDKPVLELPIWEDQRPFPRNLPRSSGVSLGAEGGDCGLRRVLIDRDVFYYSGWEQDGGETHPLMKAQGEVFINSGSFFPMGDHCPSSFDARSWGPVPLDLLRGPALYVWWPLDRFGKIASP